MTYSKPIIREARPCVHCGQVFTPGKYTAKLINHCSYPCYYAAGGDDDEPREDSSPNEWDGETQYSDVEDMPQRLEANCLMCSRAVDNSDKSAWEAAVSTRRCSACGGTLVIEDALYGSIGSPAFDTVRVYQSHAGVRPVPRGRKA